MSQEPTNIFTYFYDTSSIALSFTEASSNIFNSAQTYYYMAQATDISNLKTTYATGKTSPIFITGLSAGFTYTCYLYTVQTASSDSIAIKTLSYPSIDSVYFSELSMNSIKVKWVGSDISYVKITKSIGTNNNYIDISSNSLTTPYSDTDISGNTTYYYYVTPYMTKYGSLITGSVSNILTGTTPVAYPTDVSATFIDLSAIQLTFTAPKNTYTTSVIYTAQANYQGNIITKSGTSPILLQNLSAGTIYACYINTILDDLYTGTSTILNVTTNSGLLDNLIYYYKFDNGDITGGQVANYATGTAVFGGSVTTGSITTTGYKVGSGFYAGGTTLLSLPSFNTGSTVTGFTLAIWYKYSNNTYAYSGICGFVQNWGGNAFTLTLGSPSGNRIMGLVVNAVQYDYAGTLNTNTWYHIVYVISATTPTTITLYLNGVLTQTFTNCNYPNLNQTYPYCSVNGRNNAFESNGSAVTSPCFDDFRLYRKPLILKDIIAIYNNTI